MGSAVDVIRARIEEMGMTIKAAAEKSDVISFDALSQSLCGKRRLMATELIGLCRILNLNFKDFRA